MGLVLTQVFLGDGFFNEGFFQANVILQSILNGLGNGALYGFVALTLVLVYRTAGQLNFAQGEMAMFGAFIAFTFANVLGLPLIVAVLLAMVAAGLGGAGIYLALVRPVRAKSWYASMVVILAVFLILNAGAAAIWGTSNEHGLSVLPNGLDDQIVLVTGSPNVRLTFFTLGAMLLLGLFVFGIEMLLRHTKLGLAYRAVSSNPDSAALVGIGIKRVVALGWGLAAAVGALVGVLVSQQTTVLNNNLMLNILLFGFAAAALGGFDSVVGAAVGGLIVGLVEAIVPSAITFLGTELNTLVALAVIFLVLLIRPNGLFGSKKVARA